MSKVFPSRVDRIVFYAVIGLILFSAGVLGQMLAFTLHFYWRKVMETYWYVIFESGGQPNDESALIVLAVLIVIALAVAFGLWRKLRKPKK